MRHAPQAVCLPDGRPGGERRRLRAPPRTGRPETLKLKLTEKALRKLKKLRGVKVTVRVTQGSARKSVTLVLR